MQGPYDAGRPLGDALRSSVLSPVVHSSFGTGAAVRIAASVVMLAGLVIGLITMARTRPGPDSWSKPLTSPAPLGADGMSGKETPPGRLPPMWLLATWAGAAGLVVSLSLSGHATTGRWEPFGFIADLVHVSAASVWVGGLLVADGRAVVARARTSGSVKPSGSSVVSPPPP